MVVASSSHGRLCSRCVQTHTAVMHMDITTPTSVASSLATPGGGVRPADGQGTRWMDVDRSNGAVIARGHCEMDGSVWESGSGSPPGGTAHATRAHTHIPTGKSDRPATVCAAAMHACIWNGRAHRSAGGPPGPAS